MQITLIQSEIEQAITEYIHTQINVRAGMAIEIDLAATRGQQGFTASINIVPETKVGGIRLLQEATPVPDPEPTPVAAVARPLAISRAINKTKPEPESEPTTEANAPVEVQQALPLEEASDEAAVDAVMQTTGRRPSLFGGLAKPVNS